MRHKKAKQKNIAVSVLTIFFFGAVTLYGLSRLPFFYPDKSADADNPYDLTSLETMSAEERDETISKWAGDWRAASEEEKQRRADQYLDAVVNFVSEKLEFNQVQKVETRSLIKGAALIANELNLREKELEQRREIIEQLRREVLKELDRVMTAQQREEMQVLIQQRQGRRRPRYVPLRDGPPE